MVSAVGRAPRAERPNFPDAAPIRVPDNVPASCPGRALRSGRDSRAACLPPAGLEPRLVSEPRSNEDLARENAYLRLRVAQLQDDLIGANADADRLRQIVERLHGRTPPNPLSGV